ncbi:WD40 repeat-like protein [Calocera cornea HHB12733]|uniref:WD40 repeat-like protein n=1 Tax=Calocera cornea HHB12733 TaxID=1353952 RepID=A0A165K107_9BASI|nr:WD40 repeat-like protein [Calocera cornea HHB12733]
MFVPPPQLDKSRPLVLSKNVVRPTEEDGKAPALENLHWEDVAQEFKAEGEDWYAIYNPHVRRELDVKPLHTLQHESVVCIVGFSKDGTRIVTGSHRSVDVFDAQTGRRLFALVDDTPDDTDTPGDNYMLAVCFSPDGTLVAAGGDDRKIRGHTQEIYSIAFAPDGTYVASGSGDNTVLIWEVGSPRLPPLQAGHESLPPSGVSDSRCLNISPHSTTYPGFPAAVTNMAVSPDSRLVTCGCLDSAVYIWDVRNGNMVRRLSGHTDGVYSVVFVPDGGALDYVLTVATSPDGKWVLSGSKDCSVHFWDAHSGPTQLMLQGHLNSVISVHMCTLPGGAPGQGLLATGSGDRTARVWRYRPHDGAEELVGSA